MTTIQFSVESTLEGWMSNKKRPFPKRLEILERYFQEGFDAVAEAIDFDIADSYYCEELDLPHGSSTLQLVAALLDLQVPEKEEMPRLAELNKELIYYGHLEEEV